MDTSRIIGEVYRETGVAIEPGDPVLVSAVINRLVSEADRTELRQMLDELREAAASMPEAGRAIARSREAARGERKPRHRPGNLAPARHPRPRYPLRDLARWRARAPGRCSAPAMCIGKLVVTRGDGKAPGYTEPLAVSPPPASLRVLARQPLRGPPLRSGPTG